MRRVRRLALILTLTAAVAASPARAQTQPDLVRLEWLSGVLFQGSMADASFQLDTTPFGGQLIQRSGGTLDVDPSLYFGVGASYRLGQRLQIVASWMHSEGRYRVQFPALSRDEGTFDLEALILSGFDFQAGRGSVESAMSLAKSDAILAGVQYELPVMRRWLFPFVTASGGLFRQRSDGSVFKLEFSEEVPPGFEIAERSGVNPLSAIGISIFSINTTDALAAIGGGLRASLGAKWGVELELEDLMRFNADLSHLNDASTPPPDAENFRLYQTTFRAQEGIIHNLGVRLAFHYAVWPFGAPR